MKLNPELLSRIKNEIKQVEPTAQIILYGSYARGDANEESDIDLLILVDQKELSFSQKQRIAIPLYRLAYKTDHIISPLVQSTLEWENKYYFTPLYENIRREGVEI